MSKVLHLLQRLLISAVLCAFTAGLTNSATADEVVKLRVSIIPVFFVFPIAFTLNRLGQHYDIDPDDPAKWGTLMRGHWFWDFAFLNSNYHLEHHYFPGVPFYRLPALQKALVPFYQRKHMRWQSYGRLVYGWIVENRAPHTDWSRPEGAERPHATAQVR